MAPRWRILGLLAVFLATSTNAKAADQWVEVGSPHFTLLTDAGDKDGRHILDQFERMRWVFEKLFPQLNVDPAAPIVVLAAKNDKTFTAMEPAAYLARGSLKLGGYFLHSTDRNYVLLNLDAQAEHPYATIYHEYTHVQFAPDGAWMPLWLNEGLAEFFQNTQINGKNVELGQPSADDIFYLREHAMIPLKVLFAVDRNSPYYHEEQKGSVFYAESWALTHYLMVTDRARHARQMDDYMALVRNHEDPVTAAQTAFGDLHALQDDLGSYIQQASYKEIVLNSAAAPIDESSFKSQALSLAQADAVRADVLASVGRTDEARALAESVLQADPNSVQARETMGWLEFRAGHRDEARRWYGEAIKLGSQDFLAYFYFAQFSMGQGGAAEEQVESSLRTAIRLNPRFAPAYDRLAACYAEKLENLDEAHTLQLQAIELDPTNVIYRLNASNVLMAMYRYDDALAVLKEALKVAANQSQAALVQSRLQTVEAFKNGGEEATAGVVEQENDQPPARSGVVDLVPAHPTVKATTHVHTATGVIHHVTCTAPRAIEFRLEAGFGKSIDLYNNDFTTIQLTAAAPFSAGGTIFPCTDFEGRTAAVEYVDSPDKTVDGQANKIELEK